MPRGKEHDLGSIHGGRTDRIELARELRLRDPEIEPRHGLERLAQWRRVRADERRQLVEDSGDLLLFGDLCLAPGVAQLDDDERLDEERLPAPRGVVDDALDPAACLGLDGHDVAAIAERDDRLLERRAELRAHERVEPASQPVVRDADRGPETAETWRRGVEQLAHRIEAPPEGRAHGWERMDLASELAQEWPPVVGEDWFPAGQPHRASRRSRGSAPGRAGHHVPRAPPTDRCPVLPRSRSPAAPRAAARAWSVSSSARDHDDRVG